MPLHIPKTQKGLKVRRICFEVLKEQEETDCFLKDILPDAVKSLIPMDQNLVKEIVTGVIRWKSLLDYNIALAVADKRISHNMGNVFRLTAYQLYFLKSVPDYAAVFLGVELIKQIEGKRASGFANALLKIIARQGLSKLEENDKQAQSINTSHPEGLVKAWAGMLNSQQLQAALEAGNNHRRHWVRVNLKKMQPAQVIGIMGPSLSSQSPAVSFPFIRVDDELSRWLTSDLFKQGCLAIQDPSSLFACRLLDIHKNDIILDMCSAPGGKASLISENFISSDDHTTLICGDISTKRLSRLKDSRRRLGHTNLLPVVCDGRQRPFKRMFNKILLDCPCSNSGVMNQRPESKWRWSPASLKSLQLLQRQLLKAAAALARPGGVVVYATCSPSPGETLDIVKRFLKKNPQWELQDAASYIPPQLVREGCLWVFPGESEYDGFFAARLKFKES